MAKGLSDDEKYWRGLKPGQLADAVGGIKAAIGALNDRIVNAKNEALRRGLKEADGELFRITLSEPGTAWRLDRKALEAAHPKIVASFLAEEPTEPVLRCVARKQLPRKAAA